MTDTDPGPGPGGRPHAFFEQQRALLVEEVATNLEAVLQNLNKLNRGLEGISAVGNEFGQVEGLWSRFEDVMVRDVPVADADADADAVTVAVPDPAADVERARGAPT